MSNFITGRKYKVGSLSYENSYPFVKGEVFECFRVDEEGGCWTNKVVLGSDITEWYMGGSEELSDGSILDAN